MTYEEQLNSLEWKNKREEILKRDGYKCQKCTNKNYLENYSLAISCGRVDAHTKSFACQDLITLNISYIVCHNVYTLIDKGIYILYTENDSKNYLMGVIDLKAEIIKSYSGSLDDYTPFNFFEKILSKEEILNSLETLNWKYLNNIHIHHKYYQINKLAWEYPDDALQTLCWECHELLHKNTKISIIDEYGIYFDQKNVCSRCYGAGWFPEFGHVQGGICFKCNGLRFE